MTEKLDSRELGGFQEMLIVNSIQVDALAQLLIEAHPTEAKAHAIYGDLLYQDKQNEDALE